LVRVDFYYHNARAKRRIPVRADISQPTDRYLQAEMQKEKT